MSQKTDSPEFAPGFLWQIILLTIAALCLVVFLRSQSDSVGEMGISSPTSIFPWMIGEKQTIENGLRAFSGKPPEPPPAGDRARALGPILIGMVLCPTIFFLEWRRRRMAGVLRTERPPLKVSGYAFCGLVTVIVAVALGPIAYFGERTRASLYHAQAVQGNRDLLINELNTLAVDAAQYYILPKSLGGGGRNFEGYSIPEKLAKSEEASYAVKGKRSVVTFHARSVKYPLCTIDVNVDSIGYMRGWVYEGEFK